MGISVHTGWGTSMGKALRGRSYPILFFLFLLPGCQSTESDSGLHAINPGLYHSYLDARGEDGPEHVYIRFEGSGGTESRQYTEDSIVWWNSKGRMRFAGDSVFYESAKMREFETDSSLPGFGTWPAWFYKEDVAYRLSDVYPEISGIHFMMKFGSRTARFDRIGGPEAPWPFSKNAVPPD